MLKFVLACSSLVASTCVRFSDYVEVETIANLSERIDPSGYEPSLDFMTFNVTPSGYEWGMELSGQLLDDLEVMKVRTTQDGLLHFMRCPKTGSISGKDMLSQDNCACHPVELTGEGKQCAGDHLEIHFHTVFPSDLPKDAKPFQVLRNPYERFVSQWFHMHVYMPHECSPHFNKDPDAAKLYKAALETPMKWGAFIRSWPWRSKFLERSTKFWKTCATSMIMWPQSAYAASNSQFVCLPSLQKGMQSIMDASKIPCEMPNIHANSHADWYNHAHVQNTEVREAVADLYADDIKLYEKHCGKTQ